ncbi:MAG: alpha-amylase [Bacteroidetes bacterium]|uniref:Alpha-amylase n=1 Tax=Candidatus Cryptobacteroides intestinavium TaxID=2840766 RepID=A0A9D9ESC5_9BACT|nr:alpha-amylase [Candidatus Cryptobacteroides intestinavium]
MDKPIIYQVLPRLWGNCNTANIKNGTLDQNGTGRFSDIDSASLDYFRWLGCSHIWYTGVIRHATRESSHGCISSNPQFVKGNAGSPYAIVDYYDVNPYLAEDPDNRMAEFESLLKRTHDAGLKAIIDFVPNHVSRDYGKVSPVPGHPVLGDDDDRSVHWKPENDFYYYPGQELKLPVPPAPGCEAYREYPAMATGNNCFSPEPGINDWYETVKINYCETWSPTWDKMYDIVRFWAGKGVDGFRCDMVELVPAAFFRWLIDMIHKDFPEVIFIAEVYQKDLYRKYIREVGFDYLYDKSGLYDTLRTVVAKNVDDNGMPVELWQSAEGITRNWQYLGDLQPYMLNFLENHDEQRFASDFFGKDAAGSFAALNVSLCLNPAPFMLYMGQEIGERGMDEEGFSGCDGRTTIFDWWSVSSLRKLYTIIHKDLYKSIESGTLDKTILSENGITEKDAMVFRRYARAMRFAAKSGAVRKGISYDLCYCNTAAEGFDKTRHFAWLRDYGEETLLFVANFSDREAQMELTIPEHAFEWMELPVTPMLNPETRIRVNVPPMDATMFTLSEPL